MKRIYFLLFFAIAIISCRESGETKNTPNEVIEVVKENPEKIFDNSKKEMQIARFAIASIMNQKKEIIVVKQENNIYLASYNEPDEGKLYEYKIKINGNQIAWGNANGRWRDSNFDEIITFEEDGDKITIRQSFDDGSAVEKEYVLNP